MNNISTTKRDNAIDLMKGFITILMILSHSIIFTGLMQEQIYFYVNLTTFSGFMFCFGYVCNMAYIQKDNIPWQKMIRKGLKTFGVYYISAFLYLFLVTHDRSTYSIIDLLTQKQAAGYSEFLLSWAYLYFIMIIFSPILKIAAQKKSVCIALILFSLALTFIDYNKLTIPWLGPVIGCNSACYFPLLQYFSFFLAGSYLNQSKKIFSLSIFLISLLCSVACIVYIIRFSVYPQRWGPSLLWIVGGYFYIYIYYIAAKKMVIFPKISAILEKIGKNTLLFLIVNNIVCFINQNIIHSLTNPNKTIQLLLLVITFGVSVAVSLLLIKIAYKQKKRFRA